MTDVTIKRFDTYPPLQAVLSDINGAINLTSASQVKFLAKGAVASISGICTIPSAPGGFIQYAWRTNDLAVVDTYSVEFEIDWQAGGIQTVPNSVYNSIVVIPDLEDL